MLVFRSEYVNSINILIIDDTKELLSSLDRALSTNSVIITTASNPDEAFEACQSKSFDLFIIDCMLPKMNGTELAKKLHEKQSQAKILMMSGIFKDTSFTNQLKNENYISDFLEKPFEVEVIKNFIKETWPKISANENSKNYPFLKTFSSASEVTDFLLSSEEINSYCLPKILSSILQFKINGTLSFKKEGHEVEVIISNQKIVRVSSSDRSTSFGEVLSKLGFIDHKVVDDFYESEVHQKSGLPLGTSLAKNGLMSPHASIVANKGQMVQRLTSLFKVGNLNINFTEHDIKPIDASHLIFKDLKNLTDIWTTKLVSENWLKEVFESLKDLKPNLNHEDSTESIHLQRINTGVVNKQPIELINTDLKPIELYKSLFYAFSLNQISIKQESPNDISQVNNTELNVQSLNQLIKSFKYKDAFEILNAKNNMSDKEIQKRYHSMAKNLHPDKLSDETPDDVRALVLEVFGLITEAFNKVKTADSREKYLNEVEQTKTNERLLNEDSIKTAKELLFKSKYTKAYETLNSPSLKENPPAYFDLYYCWAGLKTSAKVSDLAIYIESFLKDDSLKRSVEGYFVQGLIELKNKDFSAFESMMKICLKKEPSFLPAKREVLMYRSKLEEQTQNTKTGWNFFKKSS